MYSAVFHKQACLQKKLLISKPTCLLEAPQYVEKIEDPLWSTGQDTKLPNGRS